MLLSRFLAGRLAVLAMAVTPFIVLAETAQPALNIPYLADAATIDGRLDEPQWQQAKRISVNNITWPYENKPSPVSTTALIYENDDTLYLGFIAEDTHPEEIRAFYRDRDSAWDDDLVGIKLDTYGSAKLAYQFFVNPLGVQQDSIENELSKTENSAWDGIWDSAGHITAQGYQVEIALPMRMFNFDDAPRSQAMTMELVRFYPRNERLRLSSMQLDHGNHCWICQMPQVNGFANAEQSSNLTVVPSLVLNQQQQRDINGATLKPWQKDNNIEPSLDLKWGITPDLTLNATVNPDFSQVEADVAQLNVNESFSLFFPEKRSFFLDNADYFASNLNLIYTRNIAAPGAGAKLTGSKNGHTVAAFISNDEQTNVLIPGNLGSRVVSLEQHSQAGALRYRYDISSAFSLGASSTFRRSDDYHNEVLSIDSKYRFDDFTTLVVQALASQSDYSEDFIEQLCDADEPCQAPPAQPCDSRYDCSYSEALLRVNERHYDGYGYYLSLDRDTKYYSLFGNYHMRSRGLRADLGFLSETDFNKFTTGGEYRWYAEQDAWWNRARWYADWDITHNQAGELIKKEAQSFVSLDGPWQSYLELGTISRERRGLRVDPSSLAIDGNSARFNENEINLFASIKPSAGVVADIDVTQGNKVDLANNRLGEFVRIRPTVNYNINSHLALRLRHTYEDLQRRSGEDIFSANLSDLRLTYQFNLRSFLRLTMIYTDIEREPSSYVKEVDARYRALSTQLLYSYKLNPQSVVFVGYSDSGYQDDDLSQLEKDNRTLFAKFSYAWIL